jgi:hypothetical protein
MNPRKFYQQKNHTQQQQHQQRQRNIKSNEPENTVPLKQVRHF